LLYFDTTRQLLYLQQDVLKTQVFLYEADMERLESCLSSGQCHWLQDILKSYAAASFFTKYLEIDEKLVL